MEKYRCDVCSYLYDPGRGDIVGGISKGVSFDDLPEKWRCPVCGVGKDEFAMEV